MQPDRRRPVRRRDHRGLPVMLRPGWYATGGGWVYLSAEDLRKAADDA